MSRGLLTTSLSLALAGAAFAEDGMNTKGEAHSYLGLWVTKDSHIRHELLANGRYDEARGARESAYRGRYVVAGDHIDYWDDTGFTADGNFIDGVLHHGGMILYRR
ncbi:Atu4866 domain-containing protein [Rhizobium sp. PL01]|uniref:Atu4866 domain-containing protein n=1 Tax=Rhizobium sp. PL01 TaxID=3085631 RepID=UPI0029815E8E|nr:Atu4866 domain-containing protein [Rhizobium sp. PL01]MDW5315077.1 Atu4866 domain-containing protein [Rhizobium sp. PL01]